MIAGLGLLGLSGCAATTPATRASTPAAPAGKAAADRDPLGIAREARRYEERGDYAAALGEWRTLQPRVPADADVELARAIDEARIGQLEAAATRLSGVLLTAAGLDTLPITRYHRYLPAREVLYTNGSFDGWHWYVWRARAEVAAARGRWEEAAIAARQCVAARPASGTERLLLATCAGRAGWAAEARAAADQAVSLDRGLPEAHYLAALWAWKDGRREEGQQGFRAAIIADSTFRPAAIALVRSRLPGAAPDSLPTGFLTGPRAVGMLTSPVGPKFEDPLTTPSGPPPMKVLSPQIPDSVRSQMQSRSISFSLFVDAEGHVILHDLPWFSPGTVPTRVVSELAAVLPLWRFVPLGITYDPRGMWLELSHGIKR